MKLTAGTRSVFFSFAAAACICTGFVAFGKSPGSFGRDTSIAGPASADVPARRDSCLFVPVAQWVNKKFVVLAKQRLFRKFGYELYLSKSLGAAIGPVDTALETQKHHLRYDKVAGSILTVVSVEPADGEYLVSFIGAPGGRKFFGKTSGGAIEGIAYAADLDSATRKWVGAAVYSRRGFITTYDSVTGAYGKISVRIQDKLVVSGVAWGLTPLPPRPLWLLVTTTTKEKGFIPIGFSWTNTIAKQVVPAKPWADEIFESDPAQLYKWDSLTWNTVNRHSIASGMTKEQVTLSWGRPQAATADSIHRACQQQWLYGSQYVCFDHDTVISVGAR